MTKHRARRAARADDTQLEDLLGFEESAPPAPRANRRQPWLVRSALQTFVASAVVYTAFHVVDLAPPYALILAVCGGAVLVRQAVASTAEPRWLRARNVVRPQGFAPGGFASPGGNSRPVEPDGWHGEGDGVLDAVHTWDRRLEWGVTGRQRFDIAVLPRLEELADERLRQRHAITRATDPVRARALLGEQLWALLHAPPAKVPSASDLAGAVSRLESL